MFGQSRWAAERGVALGLSERPYEARARFTSRRAVEVFRIWEEVFGSTQRLVRVIASQAGNVALSEILLGFEEAHRHVDAFALAMYFGGQAGMPRRSPTPPRTKDEIYKSCRETIEMQRSFIEKNRALLERYDLPLIAYEGGNAILAAGPWQNDPQLNQLMDEANRDPEIGKVYREQLSQWQALGGGLFMHYAFCFQPSKFGRWGVLEYMDQPVEKAPKYQALLDIVERARKR
jgi:hypothetical protein